MCVCYTYVQPTKTLDWRHVEIDFFRFFWGHESQTQGTKLSLHFLYWVSNNKCVFIEEVVYTIAESKNRFDGSFLRRWWGFHYLKDFKTYECAKNLTLFVIFCQRKKHVYSTYLEDSKEKHKQINLEQYVVHLYKRNTDSQSIRDKQSSATTSQKQLFVTITRPCITYSGFLSIPKNWRSRVATSAVT